ncbi:unnamed protein product [Linum tenue]|uniref:F-box domain-containing protein n=1 Tax=Linum tenue TaxID=586396 RepID=A0AAV0HVW8_9ROSI|nr:unnamed protein product [Linum tenue]
MEGDCFGKLPSELLCKIAIALPLDEAARTSVLSRRWRSQWRLAALPNRHFAGDSVTKFTPDGYPISCFDTVGDFLSWVDQVIRRREPFPPRRRTGSLILPRRTDLSIDSLGLNFDPEDPHYGWIEFNKDRSKTAIPLVDGGCTCCRSKVVSFLSRRLPQPPHGLSLCSLLYGGRRKELLKQLTLRNCDMDILSRHLSGDPGHSFECLRSLVLQKGRSIGVRFLAKFIYGCWDLRKLTLEDCSIVDDTVPSRFSGLLVIAGSPLVHLRLTRCSGFNEIRYQLGKVRRYAYPSEIYQETVDYNFADLDGTPPLPEERQGPELEMPPHLRNAWLAYELQLQNDDEEEITMTNEEEVAYNFYDQFDRN